VDLGADVNAANHAGDTALHFAAAQKFDSVVQFLIDRGAALNAPNKKGQTPLAMALTDFCSIVGFRSVVACGERVKGSFVSGGTRVVAAANDNTANVLRKFGAKE